MTVIDGRCGHLSLAQRSQEGFKLAVPGLDGIEQRSLRYRFRHGSTSLSLHWTVFYQFTILLLNCQIRSDAFRAAKREVRALAQSEHGRPGLHSSGGLAHLKSGSEPFC